MEASVLVQTIRDIVQRHQKSPTRLLQILREVQDLSLIHICPALGFVGSARACRLPDLDSAH